MLVAGLTSNLFILIVMFAIVGLTMSPFSTYSLVHFNEAAGMDWIVRGDILLSNDISWFTYAALKYLSSTVLIL